MGSKKYPGTNHEKYSFAKINKGIGYEKIGVFAELQVGLYSLP